MAVLYDDHHVRGGVKADWRNCIHEGSGELINYNLYVHVFNATGVIRTRIVFLVPLLSVSHQQQ